MARGFTTPAMLLILALSCFSPAVVSIRQDEAGIKKRMQVAVPGDSGGGPASPRTSAMAGALNRQGGSEEEDKYNAEMLSSWEDKKRILEPLLSQALEREEPLTVVDIGPAGGAIIKAMAEEVTSARKVGERKNNIKYIGVELVASQIQDLEDFLRSDDYKDHTNQVGGLLPAAIFSESRIVNGNALYLGRDLEGQALQDTTLIVESSVVHEIYSYGWVDEDQEREIEMPDGVQFAVRPMRNQAGKYQYNPKTVYKNYEEALLQLAKTGGTLAVRDGVLYDQPDEPVTFTLTDETYLQMLKMFVNDKKYKHTVLREVRVIIDNTRAEELPQEFQLPAKIVQEFMFKAGWGLMGWANEIHETYCYATLGTHALIVNDIMAKHSLNLAIVAAEQYTQDGYVEASKDKVVISQGFGPTLYPPTNLLIKVVVQKREAARPPSATSGAPTIASTTGTSKSRRRSGGSASPPRSSQDSEPSAPPQRSSSSSSRASSPSRRATVQSA